MGVLLRAASVTPLLLMSGCVLQGASSFPIVGAYFPAWLLCVLVGIFVTIGLRIVFLAYGIDAVLSLRLFTYISLGTISAFLTWLVWFGP